MVICVICVKKVSVYERRMLRGRRKEETGPDPEENEMR